MKADEIARVCHEANRALQIIQNDPGIPVSSPWGSLDPETRQFSSVVILRLGGIRVIDASGAHALEEIITSLQARGIAVLLCGVAERPLHILEAVGAIDAMNAGNHVFSSLPDAIAHAQQHVRRHLAPHN